VNLADQDDIVGFERSQHRNSRVFGLWIVFSTADRTVNQREN
jgi:hypothetical protein